MNIVVGSGVVGLTAIELNHRQAHISHHLAQTTIAPQPERGRDLPPYQYRSAGLLEVEIGPYKTGVLNLVEFYSHGPRENNAAASTGPIQEIGHMDHERMGAGEAGF